ncbi:MAG: sensor histidine kinase [Acidobacteriaceae bacterium]|nr:sensor histidine kinase [Acidobacteriaceae bacterium]
MDRSKEELRALTGALLHAQDDERRSLARELHDDISQRLAALSMLGDQVLRNLSRNPEIAQQKIGQILAQIGDVSDHVRSLSHRLHPSLIEDLGLTAALRSLTQEFGEREETDAAFFAKDAPEGIPVDVATGLYRIAEEALRAIAKHAGKVHVRVRLIGFAEGVEMQVSDSGPGSTIENHASGFGLAAMEERARLINATLDLQFSPGQGATLTVRVPEFRSK